MNFNLPHELPQTIRLWLDEPQLLDDINSFRECTGPRYWQDCAFEQACVGLVFDHEGGVHITALDQTLIWSHRAPLDALSRYCTHFEARALAGVFWGWGRRGVMVPIMLIAGEEPREEFVICWEDHESGELTRDWELLFERQRRWAATFLSAQRVRRRFGGRVDLERGLLIEPDDEELILEAMEAWHEGEQFQLPWLRAFFPEYAWVTAAPPEPCAHPVMIEAPQPIRRGRIVRR